MVEQLMPYAPHIFTGMGVAFMAVLLSVSIADAFYKEA